MCVVDARSFHVNSGMDSSAFSSPLESPEAPITSSVATLQSAESYSYRRQVRLCSGHCSEPVVVNNPAHHQPTTTTTQSSLTKTPDTPSANLTPSELSQAFTSHFTSESSLLQKTQPQQQDEPPSPPAILTPSTETDDYAHCSEDIDYLNFDEEPWDICTNVEFDLQFLNLNGKSAGS